MKAVSFTQITQFEVKVNLLFDQLIQSFTSTNPHSAYQANLTNCSIFRKDFRCIMWPVCVYVCMCVRVCLRDFVPQYIVSYVMVN